MSSDLAAGAAMLKRSTRTATPRGSGLAQAGPELALPPGFTYHTFGAFGSAMSDGFITPPIHDGMAAFDVGGGKLRIVRNHELGEGNDIPPGTVIGDPATAWDKRAPGGTTTIEVDADTAEYLGSWISLNGTDTNCAGMPTPWGTWITCEETTIGVDAGYKKPHGYVFEVDPLANEPVLTKPYKKLGRFLHEAGAVDPDTGVVYMTEDEGPDGFYRFVPEHLRRSHVWPTPDAPRQRPAEVQHHRRPVGRGRARLQLGRQSTPPTPSTQRTTPRRSSTRAVRRAAPSSWAARVAT